MARSPYISRSRYEEQALELERAKYELAILHVVLTRTVAALKVVSFEVSDEMPGGNIKWAEVQTESGSKQMTVWFEAAQGEQAVESEVAA